MRRWVIVPALSFLLFSASPTYAQLALPGIGTDLTLDATPEYPRPGEVVRLSVRSILLDLSEGVITWHVNDEVLATDTGLSETVVTVGPLGTETNVRVEYRTEEVFASASGVLRPTEVDLLWEADSYVPPFYSGRALPSAGSNVRLFAVPRFVDPDANAYISLDNLIYTWKKNGKIVQSVSGRGKHSVRMEGPTLFGSDVISVEIRSTESGLRGFASTRVTSVEPTLVLYENHPVFGLLFHRQLTGQATNPETEATFSAIPYFAPVRTPSDSGLIYDWRINGSVVTPDTSHPNTITINAEGSRGLARIELAITHATNFFLSVANSWRITLGATESSGFLDPFGFSGQ